MDNISHSSDSRLENRENHHTSLRMTIWTNRSMFGIGLPEEASSLKPLASGFVVPDSSVERLCSTSLQVQTFRDSVHLIVTVLSAHLHSSGSSSAYFYYYYTIRRLKSLLVI